MKPTILAFATSIRTGSFNQQALDIAAAAARKAGADVTEISLSDYQMPLFNGDLEVTSGIPDTVEKLGKLVASHDGLLIASPEYNGFFSPLYKNTFDWLSRLDDSPFSGKAAALLGASPGGFGGIRALPHAKLLLENLGIIVLPKSPGIARTPGSLDDLGSREHQSLAQLGEDFVAFLEKFVR